MPPSLDVRMAVADISQRIFQIITLDIHHHHFPPQDALFRTKGFQMGNFPDVIIGGGQRELLPGGGGGKQRDLPGRVGCACFRWI